MVPFQYMTMYQMPFFNDSGNAKGSSMLQMYVCTQHHHVQYIIVQWDRAYPVFLSIPFLFLEDIVHWELVFFIKH